MPLPLVILLSSLLLTLLAATFFLLSLRRRPLGQSPHCSACHYNLSFRPEDSTRCPECGANTTLPKSITTGLPQRNRRKLTLASSLLALSLLTFATLASFILPTLNLTPYKPLRWLEYDLTSSVPTQRTAALTELTRRTSPPLPNLPPDPAPYLALADRLLTRQKDPSSLWQQEMGDLLISLRSVNILDDARWSDFLTHTTTYKVVLRPTLVRGNPLPLTILPVYRAGSADCLQTDGQFTLVLSNGATQSPIATPLGIFRENVIDSSRLLRAPHRVIAKNPDLSPFADGPLTATLTITTHFCYDSTVEPIPFPPISPKTQTTHTFTLPFTLLPSSTSDLRPTSGPTLQADLESALKDGPVKPEVTLDAISQLLFIDFQACPLPESLSHDLIFLINDNEYDITTVTAARGTSGYIPAVSRISRLPPLSSPLPPTVTILLRPNPSASLLTPSPTFANVPLRFDNVPLKVHSSHTPPPPATTLPTQPTTTPTPPTAPTSAP